MISELKRAIELIEENHEVCVITIVGNDRAFSAGADIREFTSFSSTLAFLDFISQGQQCCSG